MSYGLQKLYLLCVTLILAQAREAIYSEITRATTIIYLVAIRT